MNKRIQKTIIIIFGLILILRCSTINAYEYKITANDGFPSNYFGCAVSIYGSYAIIGDTGDKINGGRSGSIYFFKKNANSWEQIQKYTPKDGNEWDEFGATVLIYGDYAIASAPGDDEKGKDFGSIYVFRKNGESWEYIQKLFADNGNEFDAFGRAVSIFKDYIFIGANLDRSNGYCSGSVYIYKKNDNQWLQIQKIIAHDGEASDYFGLTISISHNYAIIGAIGDDDNGDYSGSAYIFKLNDSKWEQFQKFIGNGANLRLGASVAMYENYAIIGANNNIAYILEKKVDKWIQTQVLNVNQIIGVSSVSISANYAIMSGSCKGDYGVAYIFNKESNNWKQVEKLFIKQNMFQEIYTYVVSVSNNKFIVGQHNGNINNTGSTLIYEPTLTSISGFVYDVSNNPVSGINITSSYGNQTKTNYNGYYELEVPALKSFEIFPPDNYPISPEKNFYNATGNSIENQNYVIQTYTISGFIRDILNQPISGAEVCFSEDGDAYKPGCTTTNLVGFYSKDICSGWSGNVTVKGKGYKYVPTTQSYNEIDKHYSDQNFSGYKLSISGYINSENSNKMDLSNVKIEFSNSISTVYTDKDGLFQTEIDYKWSGYIIPSKPGYTFLPESKAYTNITDSLNEINFTCIINDNYPTSLTVVPNQLDLPSDCGFQKLSVSTADPFVNWSVTKYPSSWMEMYQTENLILIQYSQNPLNEERQSIIEVKAGNLLSTIQINQESGVNDSINSPKWSVNIPDFKHNGMITSIVQNKDGTIFNSSRDIIAAFVGNECRGVTSPLPVSDGKRFFLQVWSNENNEQMKMKFYDATKDIVFEHVSPNIQFIPNMELGNIEHPYTFTVKQNTHFPDANNDGNVDLIDAIDVLRFISNFY